MVPVPGLADSAVAVQAPAVPERATEAVKSATQPLLIRVDSRERQSPVPALLAGGDGQSVSTVRSHGKNLFIDFANEWTLYTHMMMWGAWRVYAQGEPWRRETRKARVVLETATHCAVLFSAPICQLIHASELETHPTSELGPDLLSATFGSAERAEIRRRLLA